MCMHFDKVLDLGVIVLYLSCQCPLFLSVYSLIFFLFASYVGKQFFLGSILQLIFLQSTNDFLINQPCMHYCFEKLLQIMEYKKLNDCHRECFMNETRSEI